jgi:hypothetical protein
LKVYSVFLFLFELFFIICVFLGILSFHQNCLICWHKIVHARDYWFPSPLLAERSLCFGFQYFFYTLFFNKTLHEAICLFPALKKCSSYISHLFVCFQSIFRVLDWLFVRCCFRSIERSFLSSSLHSWRSEVFLSGFDIASSLLSVGHCE